MDDRIYKNNFNIYFSGALLLVSFYFTGIAQAAVGLSPNAINDCTGLTSCGSVTLTLNHSENELVCIAQYDLFGSGTSPGHLRIVWNGVDMTELSSATSSFAGTDYFGNDIFKMDNPFLGTASATLIMTGNGGAIADNIVCAGFSGASSNIQVASTTVFNAGNPHLNFSGVTNDGYILDNVMANNPNANQLTPNAPQSDINISYGGNFQKGNQNQANTNSSYTTSTVSTIGYNVAGGGNILTYQGVYVSAGGGSPPVSISLLYAPNDLTHTRPDFTNWVVDVLNPPLPPFSYGVLYDTTSSINSMRFSDFNYLGSIYRFTDLLFPQAVRKGVDLRPPLFSLQNIGGKDWYAVPFFVNASGTTTYGSVNHFLIANTIQPFCIIGCADFSTSSFLAQPFAWTGNGQYISPSSTSQYLDANGLPATTTNPYNCGITDLSGCFLNASVALSDYIAALPDRIQTRVTGLTLSIVSSSLGVFPISTINALLTDINQAQATSSDIIISLGGNGTYGGRTFVFLTSSTTAWIQNNLHFDYRGLFDKIIYAGTGLIIVVFSAGAAVL